ncbi:MAG TPA: DUF72 domain-containing protein [Thermoanaerobaculia bacterium]|jgi:uncharacterized protein YecE (DUF72 family)|nr:DUF72 domain-containing protein [Thermoanaerobaculia bacterium]
MTRKDQLQLFPGMSSDPEPKGVAPAEFSEDLQELGRALPEDVYLGGSTWSFPGWRGLVYEGKLTESKLAHEGLAAYAQHPLFRCVGVDRTYYAPLPPEDFAEYAAQVPDDFRFVVKAHEACTVSRWPDRPRYGAQRGQVNPLFLDAAYTADQVVTPFVEGLGPKAGALLFQFSPQDLGVPERFAEELRAFLCALPRGPVYAVEVRNREILTPAYADALAEARACHCHNVHPRMPDVLTQARLAGTDRPRSSPAPITIARWLLGPGMTYEDAGRLYAPFNKLHAPDENARNGLARLAHNAIAAGRPFVCTVNNNGEGSAPLSIEALARRITGT